MVLLARLRDSVPLNPSTAQAASAGASFSHHLRSLLRQSGHLGYDDLGAGGGAGGRRAGAGAAGGKGNQRRRGGLGGRHGLGSAGEEEDYSQLLEQAMGERAGTSWHMGYTR